VLSIDLWGNRETVKIKIGYPSENPQINIDVDISPIVKAIEVSIKETIKKLLPFKIEYNNKERPDDGKC